MFVIKQKPHPKFKRKGKDLISEQEITLEEALCGGKFTIDFLCEQKHTFILDPEDQLAKPNDILVADDLGLPDFKNPGLPRGKLYLIVAIKFPKDLQEENHEKLIEVS